METLTHNLLKRFAAAFLLGEGYLAVGLEVRCPGSRYRADVAGFLDRLPYPKDQDDKGPTLWSTVAPKKKYAGKSRTCEPRSVIIECKQSRADFIRDDKKVDELVTLREEAEKWRRHLEEKRIKLHEPELRISDSALFPEMESWDFNASRLTSYKRLLRRIRRIEQQLYGETKFNLMARYRLADHLYIAAPRGLIRKREIPTGWGLLDCPREVLKNPNAENTSKLLRIVVDAPKHEAKPERRQMLLRNIAIAATRDSLRKKPKKAENSDSIVETKDQIPSTETRTTPPAANTM